MTFDTASGLKSRFPAGNHASRQENKAGDWGAAAPKGGGGGGFRAGNRAFGRMQSQGEPNNSRNGLIISPENRCKSSGALAGAFPKPPPPPPGAGLGKEAAQNPRCPVLTAPRKTKNTNIHKPKNTFDCMGVAVGHGDRTPKIIGLSFDTPPLSGAGPQSRTRRLSFDTPPYRGPGPSQRGCGLSFDTPP